MLREPITSCGVAMRSVGRGEVVRAVGEVDSKPPLELWLDILQPPKPRLYTVAPVISER